MARCRALSLPPGVAWRRSGRRFLHGAGDPAAISLRSVLRVAVLGAAAAATVELLGKGLPVWAVAPEAGGAGGRRSTRVALRGGTGTQAPSKVGTIYDVLKERGVVDTAIPVVPFLEPELRNEFAYLVEEKPQPAVVADGDGPLMPVVNDTARTLYAKLRMLTSDEDVQAFRDKLDVPIKQALQERIEQEQASTADALSELDWADAEEAEQAWAIFGKQFPKPVETGVYMTTPTREADIKYRWRRLKETLGVNSGVALEILSKDAAPMFVDPDFIARCFRAMCRNLEGGREEALRDLVLRHPGSLIADAKLVSAQLGQAKITAAAIDATRGLFSWARDAVFDNGRKVPIGRRDEPAFGGGFPAWKRQWEEAQREKEKAER